MARSQTPSYCLHRPTGQAYLTLPASKNNGSRKPTYLGRWGSEESFAEYEATLLTAGYPSDQIDKALRSARHDAVLPHPLPKSSEQPTLTVRFLFDSFMHWAPSHYRLPIGTVSREVDNFKDSFRDLLAVYGHRLTESLVKRDLEVVRDGMVDRGLSRKVVNQRISRIQHVFRWGTEENRSLVPDQVAAVLSILVPLQPYRTKAKEKAPVVGVPARLVERAAEATNPVVATMMRLQLLTGMRPGEVRGLKRKMVVMRDGETVADFGIEHKMAYRKQSRVVPLGPKAQELLQDWLRRCPTDDSFVFRPTQQKGSRGRLQQFTRYGYDHSVKWACKKVGIKPFAPNQIRHTVGEEVRRSHGLEFVQALLGHKTRQSSERYAPVVQELAAQVAKKRG